MKKLILALLLVPALASAQAMPANFTYSYDVASSSLTYCTVTGVGDDPFGLWRAGKGAIETSGSSTTVTGVSADDDVFESLAVGDVIQVRTSNGTVYIRVLTAKASSDSVTVDSAINLDVDGGYIWSWKDTTCGTTADDGWIPVDGDTAQMTVQYEAGDLDTLDVAFYCKEAALGAAAVRVYPGVSSDCGDGTLSGTVCTFASTGSRLTYKIVDNAFAVCRVGLKYGSSDGGTREEVTVTISVVK